MRLFTAIELPPDVRHFIRNRPEEILSRLIRGDGRDHAQARIVRADNLHITLKFFGDVPDDRVPRLQSALGRIPHGVQFLLWPGAIHCFPEKRGPVATIVLKVMGEIAALCQLHANIERAAQEIDCPPERRAFQPHITLIRARPPFSSGVRKFLETEPVPKQMPPSFTATQFVLMRSELTPSGSVYVPLERFPIAAKT